MREDMRHMDRAADQTANPGDTTGSIRRPRRTRAQAVRHTRLFRWIDPRVTHRPAVYLTQSGLAAVALAIILLVEDILINGAIVAAIAATVAIVFFVPHSIASSPFRIIGGHLMAVISAYIVVGLNLLLPGAEPFDSEWVKDISGALSVGLVILLMTATNTEHAPAAGTALGLSVRGAPWEAVVFIVTAAIAVALVRKLFGDRLKNLI